MSNFTLEEGVLRAFMGEPDHLANFDRLSWFAWGPIKDHRFFAGITLGNEGCSWGIGRGPSIYSGLYPSPFADLMNFLQSDEFKEIWSKRYEGS